MNNVTTHWTAATDAAGAEIYENGACVILRGISGFGQPEYRVTSKVDGRHCYARTLRRALDLSNEMLREDANRDKRRPA